MATIQQAFVVREFGRITGAIWSDSPTGEESASLTVEGVARRVEWTHREMVFDPGRRAMRPRGRMTVGSLADQVEAGRALDPAIRAALQAAIDAAREADRRANAAHDVRIDGPRDQWGNLTQEDQS